MTSESRNYIENSTRNDIKNDRKNRIGKCIVMGGSDSNFGKNA